MANDQVAQLPVEVALLPSNQKARVAQEVVEAVVAPSIRVAQFGQVVVEVAYRPTIDIPAASLTLATFAPVVGGPVDVAIPAGALALASFAPVVDLSLPTHDMVHAILVYLGTVTSSLELDASGAVLVKTGDVSSVLLASGGAHAVLVYQGAVSAALAKE